MAGTPVFEPYIKDEKGELVPVVAVYDKDGHEITAHYQPKTGLSLKKDSDGFIVVESE